MTRDTTATNDHVPVTEPSSAGPMHAASSGVLGVERYLAERMLRALHNPPVRLSLWDGEVLEPNESLNGGSTRSVATVRIHDRPALYRLLADPDKEFGTLYSDGRITIEGDLVAFLEAAYRSMSASGSFRDHLPGFLHHVASNNVSRSRINIHRHYDIGNAFYRLWLDEAMVYTCAYFAKPDMSLEQAQQAKMDHVCRKLRLKPGQSVVEAGCGWGSLAIHMAQRYGVRVRAFNISREQNTFARARARALGLEDRVEFVKDDYRNIKGRYDAFVSVGMLEHVGTADYGTLGRVIDGCLTENGMGLIHSIGRNRPMRMNPWIATYIFPGGYTPALSEMAEIFEPAGFSVLDVENLRLHYALTLRHWLERFQRSEDRVNAMFDDRFVRAWRLYLAGSLAAFSTGWMQLFQVVFTRWSNNDLAMTRGHLHQVNPLLDL